MSATSLITRELAHARAQELFEHAATRSRVVSIATRRPRRRFVRLMVPVLVLVACAGVGGTARAAAGYPRHAKFWVTITAHQHVSWKIAPPSTGCSDALERGAGREDIAFRTPRVKVVAIQWNKAGAVSFHWNTWNMLSYAPQVVNGLHGKAELDRTGYLDQGCVSALKQPDCGTRHANWIVGLLLRQDKLAVTGGQFGVQPPDSTRWVTCPVSSPPEVVAGEWTSIEAPLPARELFDPSLGKQIVLGKKSFTLKRTDPTGPSGSASVRWEVTFTRVK
jgi:hypothetical protein